MVFQKGISAWNKGLTKETDERIRKYAQKLKGNELWKLREKPWNKGLTKENNKIIRERISKNKIRNKKISESLKKSVKYKKSIKYGKKNWNWNKGLSKKTDLEKYGIGNTKHYKLTKSIFKRDKHICQYCKKKSYKKNSLDTHHKDGNKKNIQENNLITLHKSCHQLIEKNMVIARVRGGWVILHHKKKGMIGKRINATKKPIKSYAKILKIHRAIMLSKMRRGEAY